ncbi:Orotate phosphoribosyltransferase [hydrothermal vent metagenome]|uniref:orotate phosphoribosyltransferase n=1 Tax=hydrothermal vent metagenome TaxID=652676 RepID=A0A3B0UAZ0_9ZZZZ
MIINPETAERVALHLLEINAIKLSPEKPVIWASGLHSPIYCDNRLALSYPAIRDFIRQELTKTVKEKFSRANLVAGVATAGIPQGVLVAQDLNLPFAYVRSSAKTHGMTNRIEGLVQKGQTAIVVEDLVSTGKSSLAAVEALRKAGIQVTGMISIFTYDLPVARENFEKANCRLVSLSDYPHLMEAALSHNFIDNAMLKSLYAWREDPKKWSETHAG